MDSRLIAYLYFFNVKQDYYECHEYGEHLWLEQGRPEILKGLIQAAVCIYHLQNGNIKGGQAMWRRARNYLQAGRPEYESIDIDKLIADLDALWALVPLSYAGKIVSTKSIEQLCLPTIKIRVQEETILRDLPTFEPPVLDE